MGPRRGVRLRLVLPGTAKASAYGYASPLKIPFSRCRSLDWNFGAKPCGFAGLLFYCMCRKITSYIILFLGKKSIWRLARRSSLLFVVLAVFFFVLFWALQQQEK